MKLHGLVGAVALIMTLAPAACAQPPAGELPAPSFVGSSYYAQFPVAKAAGWANPKFFPIALWFESVVQQAAARDKSFGINTFEALTANSHPGLATAVGMFTIPQAEADSSGTWHFPHVQGIDRNTVGYFVDDEADMADGPGDDPWDGVGGYGHHCKGKACGYTVQKTLAAGFPKDGRFLVSNFGKGLFWEKPAQFSRFVNGPGTDVVSVDAYWYARSAICTAWQGAVLVGTPGTPLTPDQCHRASNYGRVVERVRQIVAMGGKPKPVWGFVELAPGKQDLADHPTGDEIQGAVVSMLIHGANGIIYFNHHLSQPCGSIHYLRDVERCIAKGDKVPNIVPKVRQINALITRLAPVLNSPPRAWTFNADLDSRLSYGPDGAAYVFAQQRSKDSGSYELSLPPKLAGATRAVDVVDGKTVRIAGGKLRADFAHEYSWYIWKIAAPGGSN